MYRLGERNRRHRRRGLVIAAVVVLILTAAGLYAYRYFSAETQAVVHNAPAVIKPADIPVVTTTRFDETVFGFELPADWKKLKTESGQYAIYSYQSSLTNNDNRYLDIYLDKIPVTMAVNKAVAVHAAGTKLSHGVISDNCLTFTTPVPTGEQKATILPARWDGIQFFCDTDNTSRNVVGISSPDHVNQVALTGPVSGQHSFLFVYTDNNHSPDYTIFYKMLDSFAVK